MNVRFDEQAHDGLTIGVFMFGVFLLWVGRRLNSVPPIPKTSLELEL